jgi:hypothetical protein
MFPCVPRFQFAVGDVILREALGVNRVAAGTPGTAAAGLDGSF